MKQKLNAQLQKKREELREQRAENRRLATEKQLCEVLVQEKEEECKVLADRIENNRSGTFTTDAL